MVSVSCTPTTTPTSSTTTGVVASTTSTSSLVAQPVAEDFTFFSDQLVSPERTYSSVFDADGYTRMTLLVSSNNSDNKSVGFEASVDGVNWFKSTGKDDNFLPPFTNSIYTNARYYRAYTDTQFEIRSPAKVTVIARFSK